MRTPATILVTNSPHIYSAIQIEMPPTRVINVLTQLPLKIEENPGSTPPYKLRRTRGTSALFSLVQYLAENPDYEQQVVAWTGEAPWLLLDERRYIELQLPKGIHPVWLDDLEAGEDDTQLVKWRRYPEWALWPVFHYIQNQPSDGKAENEWWHDYVKFNEAYFHKIKLIYKPGDIIWIHDYYLLLLPQLCRTEWPDATIGFFMHAPWPSLEYFRCIPKRSALLEGVLGVNQIGFQLPLFANHFLLCCQRIDGCQLPRKNVVSSYGNITLTITLPILIDAKQTEAEAFTSAVDEKVAALKEVYGNCKIIVGRDRLDSVRGVVQKLEAFEMFLQMYKEWRGKVVLMQVLSLGYSHGDKVEDKVTELVTRINAKYGLIHFTPVLHYQMYVVKEEYLALLRCADVCLITSVRDGMNTTLLEYVVCQKDTCLPLILLEFTGTLTVLKDAILVNPWDSVGIAKQLNECLKMPMAQKQNLESRLYAEVKSNTVQKWTTSFLSKLIAAKDHENGIESRATPPLDRPLLYNNYVKAERRLFLFDYDGTLTPIVQDPNAAIPSLKLNELLRVLARDPKNEIWIILGRDQAFLDKWMGDKNVGLLAEHGCFMKDVDLEHWENLAAKFDMLWQAEVDKVFIEATEACPGCHVERKKVALTWHYRRAEDYPAAERQAKKTHDLLEATVAKKYPVEVMEGKANIEVRPKFLNKGEIVKRLVLLPWGQPQDLQRPLEYNPKVMPDFVLCLGDDQTDEDMFRSLIHISQEANNRGLPQRDEKAQPLTLAYGYFPVVVGPALKQTVAPYHLHDPHQVLETLGLLAGQVLVYELPGTAVVEEEQD